MNQIDQREELLFYYEHLYGRGKQREKIQFETRVGQIAKNFVRYIRDCYQKIFAEIALASFQYQVGDEQRPWKADDPIQEVAVDCEAADTKVIDTAGKEAERLVLAKRDFKKALSAMGTAGFRIDLNFAFIMYCKLQETQFGKLLEQMEDDASHMALLSNAQDIVFQETIKRNFSPCPVDEQYFIFKDNPEDSVLPRGQRRFSQRSNAPSNPAKKFDE